MNNNNRDIVSKAGVSDGTSLDTFFEMQGKSVFLTEEDLNSEVPCNIEVLHDGELSPRGEVNGERTLVKVGEDSTRRYEQKV